MRTATVARDTKETAISVTVALDGTGTSTISTGVGFFDHMLDQLARHSLIDMTIEAKGDRHIDDHHTVEDTGIALGQAIRQALGDRAGIARYADALLPMGRNAVACGDRCLGTAVPGVPDRLPSRDDRDVRYRAGARVLSGFRDECRYHAAYRNTLRHEMRIISPNPASRPWLVP